MKKVLFPALAVAAVLMAFNTPKVYNIKLSDQEVQKHWQNLTAVQQLIDQSSMPHDKAKFCLESIEELKQQIEKQVKDQFTADSTDSGSIKPKKKN